MKFSSSRFSASSHNEFCVFSFSLTDYFPLYLNGGTGNYPSKQSAPAAGEVGMPWGTDSLVFLYEKRDGLSVHGLLLMQLSFLLPRG